ncbi:GntR family transcriptional regulator [Neiella marina]|uniref:GntR family transcriptional regulator n=1 Tax=Neiella holothuriorum TaxID=2870530 RepID=A0ABS7EJQ2_9GAMM|nr:GntR family transcriptional regulator [Neiella holothuriorum]MBW8192098.1 GntR family transcriptional regulator [Neiella holothuriorum]
MKVPKTRTEYVVSMLRERILSGELKAGSALRQAALAEQIGVSRIPIREALLQLEAEGLVEFEPHKGATVACMSKAMVDDLFELRALIECDLLRRSIPQMTKEDFELAASRLDNMERAWQREDPIATWSDMNMDFHMALYRAANRPHAIDLVRTLNHNSGRYVRMNLFLTGAKPRSELEHRQLLEMCHNGEADAACELLRTHILSSAEEIKALINV